MSRGHGRVQRVILDSLASSPKTHDDLTKAAFTFATPAARESVWRALRGLRREGVVDKGAYEFWLTKGN